MTKKLSELTREAILADLRAGISKRSTRLRHGVSYYQVAQISNELAGAELGGAEKLAPQDAPSPSESDVEEQGRPRTPVIVDQGAARLELELETVIEPETGEQVCFAKVTEPILLEQEIEYLVASDPILPSKQTGTKFDEVAMQENPEIDELMHNPPTGYPTQYTDDGRPFTRRRVEWHGHKLPELVGVRIDGEPVMGELGLDAARELPGWYEDPETGKRTYVLQYHPDTPEDMLDGEPDTMEPTGKLPSGYEFSPTKGVIFRRHKSLTPEEMEQARFFAQRQRMWESFG